MVINIYICLYIRVSAHVCVHAFTHASFTQVLAKPMFDSRALEACCGFCCILQNLSCEPSRNTKTQNSGNRVKMVKIQ